MNREWPMTWPKRYSISTENIAGEAICAESLLMCSEFVSTIAELDRGYELLVAPDLLNKLTDMLS